jgi:hypothetical protein
MCRDTKTGEAPRHWRWRGALVDYYTAEAGPVGTTPSAATVFSRSWQNALHRLCITLNHEPQQRQVCGQLWLLDLTTG